jgi:SAM-dependent MidA family methyltransferase
MQRSILPEPPGHLKQISQQLSALICAEIRRDGAIPFARFMEMALYHPGLGYYSAGLHKLGAEGDFVTAPETGRLFAACVARQAADLGRELGDWDLLEIGAGTGKLAADLFAALGPGEWPQCYRILERSADLRAVQQETLRQQAPGALDRVTWLDAPPDAPWRGLLLANEVIDALAAERFREGDSGLEQVCIGRDADAFCWRYRAAPPDLEAAVRRMGVEFSTGYCSEILPGLPAWLQAVTEQMDQGLALFIDYGYPRSEYYSPQRRDGTFMCHYRHQAHGDLFFWPGLQDITAWVDFTALAEAADHCGLDVEGYCSQSMFLLGAGLENVLQQAMDGADAASVAALSAEARQLTMPGMMGEKFQVMGLGRGLDFTDTSPLSGFSLQDFRYRL